LRKERDRQEARAGGERFTRDIETAIYFCCIEALQNAVKHAAAERACIVIESPEARLSFEVGDDGHGFDVAADGAGAGVQNITDRVEALGGMVRIESGPGGTRVEGWCRRSRAPGLREARPGRGRC